MNNFESVQNDIKSMQFYYYVPIHTKWDIGKYYKIKFDDKSRGLINSISTYKYRNTNYIFKGAEYLLEKLNGEIIEVKILRIDITRTADHNMLCDLQFSVQNHHRTKKIEDILNG